jgi:hypothetical protein
MRARTWLVALIVLGACGGRGRKAGENVKSNDSAGLYTPGASGSFTAEVAMVDLSKSRIFLSSPSAAGGGSTIMRAILVKGPAAEVLPSLKRGDVVMAACEEDAASPAASVAPSVLTSAAPSSAGAAASASPSAEAGSSPPLGGNDGIGAVALGDAIASCRAVIALQEIASAPR